MSLQAIACTLFRVPYYRLAPLRVNERCCSLGPTLVEFPVKLDNVVAWTLLYDYLQSLRPLFDPACACSRLQLVQRMHSSSSNRFFFKTNSLWETCCFTVTSLLLDPFNWMYNGGYLNETKKPHFIDLLRSRELRYF